jgi:hypothetical protein
MAAARARTGRSGGEEEQPGRSWASWRWRPVARTRPPPTALKETLELRPSGRRITEARRLRQW